MTENRSDSTRDRRTVKDVDHTHPHTDEPFGASGVYDRGSEESGGDENVR
jgi:hypothetical protein